MSLHQELAEYFDKKNFSWKIDGADYIPNPEDFGPFFDEAIRLLKDEPVGATLTVGRMVIEKTKVGYDAYVFAGSFR